MNSGIAAGTARLVAKAAERPSASTSSRTLDAAGATNVSGFTTGLPRKLQGSRKYAQQGLELSRPRTCLQEGYTRKLMTRMRRGAAGQTDRWSLTGDGDRASRNCGGGLLTCRTCRQLGAAPRRPPLQPSPAPKVRDCRVWSTMRAIPRVPDRTLQKPRQPMVVGIPSRQVVR